MPTITPMSLVRLGNPLAKADFQIQLLERLDGRPRFQQTLAASDLWPFHATGIEVLQVNVGKLCNQTCRHCHVDAGPDRREIMTRDTAESCIAALRNSRIRILDITGGAPELNPNFRWLVEQATELGRYVIDRCNLTVLLVAGQRDLPEFLASHRVEIVASLPCYLAENCNAQRGDGVFEASIEALQRLNSLGYGKPDTRLKLTLVYNPVGPALPPPQQSLEDAYRRELANRYGIVFNRLYTITNMPISRFLDDLVQSGQYDRYMQKLIDAYNPAAAAGVMCRNTLSVGWDGRLYDCDFNQMLELGVRPELPQFIGEFDQESFDRRQIVTGQHCFGCTAGAGSGCQGSITK